MIRRWNLIGVLLISGCSPGPSVVRLVDVFDETMVEGGAPPPTMPARTEWRFDLRSPRLLVQDGERGAPRPRRGDDGRPEPAAAREATKPRLFKVGGGEPTVCTPG